MSYTKQFFLGVFMILASLSTISCSTEPDRMWTSESAGAQAQSDEAPKIITNETPTAAEPENSTTSSPYLTCNNATDCGENNVCLAGYCYGQFTIKISEMASCFEDESCQQIYGEEALCRNGICQIATASCPYQYSNCNCFMDADELAEDGHEPLASADGDQAYPDSQPIAPYYPRRSFPKSETEDDRISPILPASPSDRVTPPTRADGSEPIARDEPASADDTRATPPSPAGDTAEETTPPSRDGDATLPPLRDPIAPTHPARIPSASIPSPTNFKVPTMTGSRIALPTRTSGADADEGDTTETPTPPSRDGGETLPPLRDPIAPANPARIPSVSIPSPINIEVPTTTATRTALPTRTSDSDTTGRTPATEGTGVAPSSEDEARADFNPFSFLIKIITSDMSELSCDSTSDCDYGEVCNESNICVDVGTVSYCNGSTCIDMPDSCTTHDDCGNLRRCDAYTKECVDYYQCTDDNDCPYTMTCGISDGYCHEKYPEQLKKTLTDGTLMNTGIHGGGGGGNFEMNCSPGRVVIGMQIDSGADIDAMKPICQTPFSDENIVDQIVPNALFYKHVCQASSPDSFGIVTGFRWRYITGTSPEVLRTFQVLCGEINKKNEVTFNSYEECLGTTSVPDIVLANCAVTSMPEIITEDTFFGENETIYQHIAVPNFAHITIEHQGLITGIYGRSGSRIDAFGFKYRLIESIDE